MDNRGIVEYSLRVPMPDYATVAEALTAAPDAQARFAVFTQAMEAEGFDQIIFGYLDPSEPVSPTTPVRLLSNVRRDWLDYYMGEAMYRHDPLVRVARTGNLTPYRFGRTQIERLNDPHERSFSETGITAGVRSTLVVPLPGPFSPIPVAGMTFGSSVEEGEMTRLLANRTPQLITLMHLFYGLSAGQLAREAFHAERLSPRERDCLSYIAAGLKQDAIADRMGLSRVTVELHLRNARRKLKALSLTQAVARGLQFGDIAF